MMKFLCLVFLLLASPALAASPGFDTNANSKQLVLPHGVSTSNLPGLTTNLSPDLIVVVIGYEVTSGTPTVSSVTSTHLTFTKRGSVLNTTSGAARATMEVWTAPAASTLSSEVITVNWGSNIDAASVGAFAINGANGSNPFDGNASLPSKNFNTTSTTPPTVTFSTTQKDDLLLFANYNINGHGQDPYVPSGYSLTFASNALNNSSGTNFSMMSICTESVSTTQSGATAAYTTPANDVSFTAYLDALTADAAGGAAIPTRTLLGVGP